MVDVVCWCSPANIPSLGRLEEVQCFAACAFTFLTLVVRHVSLFAYVNELAERLKTNPGDRHGFCFCITSPQEMLSLNLHLSKNFFFIRWVNKHVLPRARMIDRIEDR